MLLWASLLILAPVSGQLEVSVTSGDQAGGSPGGIYLRTWPSGKAAAPKPTISLHPPWTTVFKGQRVNLTCNGFHFYAPEKIKWYRRFSGTEIKIETPGNTLQVRFSGEYRCQAQGSPPSNTVRLIFSSDPLILQVPHSMFEGDTLVLRCKRKEKEKLAAVKYIYNGKVISNSNKTLDLLIPQASSNNSGYYQCIGFTDKNYVFRSSYKIVNIQELFPRPNLKVTASQPTEGNSVNLSCETQLPLERLDTRLHYAFFRDNGVILSDWSASPELQITAIWREDSGSYWCGAETVTRSVHKQSLPLQIHVQRNPVSGVLLETQPQGGQAVEGETLALVCSVTEGTGETTFSWHRQDTKESLERKSQRSQKAELEIPVIRESHAGEYYCTADNGYGHIQSEIVNITVRSAPGNGSGLIAARATGVSLSIFLLAVALLFYCWHRRKSETSPSQSPNPPSGASVALFSTGGGFLRDTTRTPPTPGSKEPLHPMCPAPVELQLLHGNAHPREGDLVYSEIQIIRLGEERRANTTRTSQEDKHASVVYSEVKKRLPGDSAGKVRSKDEDAMESYENVPLR